MYRDPLEHSGAPVFLPFGGTSPIDHRSEARRGRLKAWLGAIGQFLLGGTSRHPEGGCKWCGAQTVGDSQECRHCMLESMLGP